MKLACPVDTAICTPVDVHAGSDDEKALRSALDVVFLESEHLLCVQHLKRNVEQRLRDKVGCTASVRRQVVHDIFSHLLRSVSDEDFDTKANTLLNKYRYCECGLFVFLILLTFHICIFPSSFFMRLTFSSIYSSIAYLPEYWTRSVSRPEVVGGVQTWV